MLGFGRWRVQKLGNFCWNVPVTAFACGNRAVFLDPVRVECKVARCVVLECWWLKAVDSWRCFHAL
jgi:hypothetical protein